MSYKANIFDQTEKNHYFRKVLFTGNKSQLVVMEIPEGGEIGEETHAHVEQTLFFLEGKGRAVIGGEERDINKGDVFIVSPGTKHNFINTGSLPLKVYTVYAPPNHIDGRIHKTKKEADLDLEDEAFGHKP